MAQNSERQALSVEWWCFGVRWLLLFAVAVVVYLAPIPGMDLNLLLPILFAIGGYNFLTALLLAFGFFPLPIAVISHTIDVAGLLAILYASGQGHSALFVLAALPVVAAGVRFGRAVSLMTAIALSAGYGLMLLSTFNTAAPPEVLSAYASTSLALLGIAALAFRRGNAATREPTPSPKIDTQPNDEATQARAALERLQTVYKLASTLSATLSYERVLDALLDISAMGFREFDGFESNSPRMVLLFHAKDRLRVVASRHLSRRR